MRKTSATRFSQSLNVCLKNDRDVQRASLVRIHPAEGLGQVIELSGEYQVLGRDAKCDIELADDSVSRRHAAIESCPDGFIVTDLGSTNGTYINDHRVTSEQIQAGDRLRFGNQIFRFLGTDRQELEYYESIYKIMTTDGLTQVYNKRYLMEVMERDIHRSQRTGRPISVLLFDVDHFKNINDTHGHLVGDEVLSELCRRAKSLVRRDEVLARYGGEEFALVMADATRADALEVAERLRRLIHETPFTPDGLELEVSVSIGVAEMPGDQSVSPAELLELADQQLYAAKQGGRNRVMG